MSNILKFDGELPDLPPATFYTSGIGQLAFTKKTELHRPLYDETTLQHFARQAIAQAAPAAATISKEFDVRTILLSVVPGDDGMGHEVHARNVDDVVREMTKLDERIEELEDAKAQTDAAVRDAALEERKTIRNEIYDVAKSLPLGDQRRQLMNIYETLRHPTSPTAQPQADGVAVRAKRAKEKK